jgi:membrane protease YdiL (CAAX protease family)
MSEASITGAPAPATDSGLRGHFKQHPIQSYFILAFLGTWIPFLPILLSRGFHVINLPDPGSDILFLIATYGGPLTAAFILTNVIDGKEGARKLLRRMVQFNVAAWLYALLLVGYPLAVLIGLTVDQGPSILANIPANLGLIGSLYLPGILLSIFIPGIGEETGWRGFALPRLQRQYGPLQGSLIMGTLHALWHLPVYFIPGAINEGPFSPLIFVTNSLAIIALTCVWTWLFNLAKGSVWFAILVHATSNASTGFAVKLVNVTDFKPWLAPILFGVIALLVILATRARLAYDPDHAPDTPEPLLPI